MRAHGVGRVVYQASAMNPAPGQPLPPHLRLLRPLVSRMVDTRGIWADHAAVIAYLGEAADDLAWTVTRAGRLGTGPSRGALVASESPGSAVRYVDLARFSLETVRSDRHVRACPYLRYA